MLRLNDSLYLVIYYIQIQTVDNVVVELVG